MIKEEDYLKAKKIVQEYENEQLNKFATNTRKYTDEINLERDDIYTIKEWRNEIEDGWISSFDGNGYWVKDGFKSNDEVFSTPQLDATHVVWYNK